MKSMGGEKAILGAVMKLKYEREKKATILMQRGEKKLEASESR